MSMMGLLYFVDDAEIDRYMRDPGAVHALLTGGGPEPQLMDGPVNFRIGMDDQPKAGGESGGGAEEHSLDKAWHGVHYLLTGDVGDTPSGDGRDFLVGGGCEVGDDTGYGPPRAYTNAELRGLCGRLPAPDAGALASRLDLAEMDEIGIYPGGIWVEEGDEAAEWIVQADVEMHAAMNSAAGRGLGMIVAVV